jgi:hypothetical protein
MSEITYLVATLEVNNRDLFSTNGFSVHKTDEHQFGAECNQHVGGWFAVVDCPAGSVWVNDEGLLLGLEQNLFATAIAQQYLVGTAVFTGPTGPNGETTSVSPVLIRCLEETIGESLPVSYSPLAIII